MSLHLFTRGTPLLDAAPPTDAERAWWMEASRPFRRRALLWGLPTGFGVMLLPALVTNPGSFLADGWMVVVPGALFVGLVSGYAGWLAQSKYVFQTQLAGRRVRERLLADGEPVRAADDSPTG